MVMYRWLPWFVFPPSPPIPGWTYPPRHKTLCLSARQWYELGRFPFPCLPFGVSRPFSFIGGPSSNGPLLLPTTIHCSLKLAFLPPLIFFHSPLPPFFPRRPPSDIRRGFPTFFSGSFEPLSLFMQAIFHGAARPGPP